VVVAEGVAEVLVSMTEDPAGSDAIRVVPAVVSMTAVISAVVEEAVVSDREVTDTDPLHRGVGREVMNVAITLVGQEVDRVGPDTVQARADHMTAQEVLRVADSKLKVFFSIFT